MALRSISQGIVKGGFVASDPQTGQTRSIVFQFNPESVQRRMVPSAANGRWPESEGVRERISLVLEVDANLGDEFFVQNEDGVSHGVLPFLSAIELLAHPAAVMGEASGSAAAAGLVRMLRSFLGMIGLDRTRRLASVGLMLGPQRIIPVKIRSIVIDEQAFDKRLNPVRAAVSIVMDTLTERESERDRHAKEMREVYRRFKATLASTARGQ